MKIRSRLLAAVSAVIGIGLFIYVINQTGVSEIWMRVRSLGIGFLLILLISSTRYWSRSYSWFRCLTPEERKVGLWTLFRTRLAGEAIGDLTFGPVVAEPMRAVLLDGKVSLNSALSSLAVENISYAVSSCFMVMAGAIALLAGFGLTESMRQGLLIALALVALLLFGAFLIINRRWKITSWLIMMLAHLIIRGGMKRIWIDQKIEKLRSLEEYVFDFYAKRPLDFFLVALSQLAFHFAGVLEIFATLRLIGVDLNFSTAFLLEAINRAINMAFIFVPALVGVDEAGTGLVTELFGYGAAVGVALAIIRKIRMFFWIGVGLLILIEIDRINKIKNKINKIEEKSC
jgi:hypothetical protein